MKKPSTLIEDFFFCPSFKMTFKKVISLSIALSFIILAGTGILSYLQPYTQTTATLHTLFGLVFILGAILHFRNNFSSIRRYIKGRLLFLILAVGSAIFLVGYLNLPPANTIMDLGAKAKANTTKPLNQSTYELIEMNLDQELKLTIDLLRSEHYWHPQMAIWTEDSLGNYLETLYVTKSTAKGIFFGGRSKQNFKQFDEAKDAIGDYRRVDALPVWSHQRGVRYADGLYAPTRENPLPDAISGATITDNFKLALSTQYRKRFRVKIEINVAFDDNEFYSEFDFPDDEIFHSDTGQLGQPSIIFDTEIDMTDGKHYYLMELTGHGHPSGQTGEIYREIATLTTALEIVERIVVGVEKNPDSYQ